MPCFAPSPYAVSSFHWWRLVTMTLLPMYRAICRAASATPPPIPVSRTVWSGLEPGAGGDHAPGGEKGQGERGGLDRVGIAHIQHIRNRDDELLGHAALRLRTDEPDLRGPVGADIRRGRFCFGHGGVEDDAASEPRFIHSFADGLHDAAAVEPGDVGECCPVPLTQPQVDVIEGRGLGADPHLAGAGDRFGPVGDETNVGGDVVARSFDHRGPHGAAARRRGSSCRGGRRQRHGEGSAGGLDHGAARHLRFHGSSRTTVGEDRF